jgi:hypothetical protein
MKQSSSDWISTYRVCQMPLCCAVEIGVGLMAVRLFWGSRIDSCFREGREIREEGCKI